MDRRLFHRPLVAGLYIESGIVEDGNRRVVSGGTLTGLARRNTNNDKMLITAQHVMAGLDEDDDYVVPTGREEMYQEVVGRSKKVGFALRPHPLRDDAANEADASMCEISAGVGAEFYLHDSNHDQPGFIPRRITAGVVEPIGPVRQTGSPDTVMELTMLGGATGEKTVRVLGAGRFESFGGKNFRGIVELACSDNPVAKGDSGAPCFTRAADGTYRMVCPGTRGLG